MTQEHAPARGQPLLCVSGFFKNVACFDPKTLQLKHEIPTPKENCRVISIPPGDGHNEELVAVGESDIDFDSEEVLLHSPHQVDSPFRKLSGSHSSGIWGLSWVPPRFVVSGSEEHAELVVSDVNSGEKVMDLKDPPKSTTRITTITTSSARQEDDGGGDVGGTPQRGNGFVFVGGGDLDGDYSTIRIRHYDLGRRERANEVLRMFEGHNRFAYGLGYSTENNLLFSSSEDQTLRIWSLQDGRCLQKLQLSDQSHSLLFDPKKRLIFCGVEGVIEVWDYRQTRERVRKFNHPTKDAGLMIHDLCQIDDDTYASIGDDDFSVATWTDRGKILATTKTSGTNFGVCCVGTQGGKLRRRAAQEERIGFLLSFSSVFWGVQVRGHGCFLRMTPAMSHPTTD